MAKRRKESTSGTSDVFSKTRPELAGMPLLNVVGKEVSEKVGKLFDKKGAQKTLKDLVSKKRTLEDIFLGLSRTATDTIDSVLREEERVEKSELLMNGQYRDSLLARLKEKKSRKLRTEKKGEFLINGRVLHPETGEPVAGMAVETINKDIKKHEVLGVDTTDHKGFFEISFSEEEFKERGEGRPEVLLRVSADRKTSLHTTNEVVKLKPGKRSSLDISLPKSKIAEVDMFTANRKHIDNKRLRNVGQTLAFNHVQHIAVQEIGKVFNEGLKKATDLLEARVEDANNTKAKKKERPNRKENP